MLLEAFENAPLNIEGIYGWTSVRTVGSFGLHTQEPVHAVYERWKSLKQALRARGADRLACGMQVHGAHVARHGPGWTGFLRVPEADGHVSNEKGTALAVTIADCTPVFLAHGSGAIALLHAGWRGTAGRILEKGVEEFRKSGIRARELECHLGPSICGNCYEVGPEVLEAMTGKPASRKGLLDVRQVLADQARQLGVKSVSISPWCTRCHNDRFYSHRAGDEGRLLAVIASVR